MEKFCRERKKWRPFLGNVRRRKCLWAWAAGMTALSCQRCGGNVRIDCPNRKTTERSGFFRSFCVFAEKANEAARKTAAAARPGFFAAMRSLPIDRQAVVCVSLPGLIERLPPTLAPGSVAAIHCPMQSRRFYYMALSLGLIARLDRGD